MIVAIIRTKSPFRPGKRKRENPYATQIADNTAPTVEIPAIANVLKNSLGNSIVSHAAPKFSVRSEKLQCCSSVRYRPTHSIGPAAGFAGSMKIERSRNGSSSASARTVPSGMGTS
jgi:hypothetical protein